MTIRSASSQTPFSSAGIVGLNSINLDSNDSLYGNSATNGDVTLAGNDQVCGTVQVGPGRNVVGGPPTCTTGSSTVTQGVTSLPPVNQGDAPTNNQNGNFFSVNPVSPASKNAQRRVCFNGRNAAGETDTSCGARQLKLTNGASGVTLTLNGGNYSLCSLTLQSGTSIYVANGARVTIYFDTPEACGYTSAATQLSMASNTSIQVNGGSAQNMRLLFVGSDTIPTTATMSSNTIQNVACNQDFVVYGPRTDIVFASNSYFCGAVAGKTSARTRTRRSRPATRRPVTRCRGGSTTTRSTTSGSAPRPCLPGRRPRAPAAEEHPDAARKRDGTSAFVGGRGHARRDLIGMTLGLLVIGAAVTVFTASIESQPTIDQRAAQIDQARSMSARVTQELRQGSNASSVESVAADDPDLRTSDHLRRVHPGPRHPLSRVLQLHAVGGHGLVHPDRVPARSPRSRSRLRSHDDRGDWSHDEPGVHVLTADSGSGLRGHPIGVPRLQRG